MVLTGTRQAGLICVALVILLLPMSAAEAQQTRWWLQSDLQQALRLSDAQIAALDREYDATLTARRALRRDMQQADDALANALGVGSLSDLEAEQLAARVCDAHRRRDVARTMLLFRLYRILSPEQRRTLARLPTRPVQSKDR